MNRMPGLLKITWQITCLAIALLAIRMARGQAVRPAASLTLPAGITLPVSLQQGIKAGKTPAGSRISAAMTQRVLLSATTDLPGHCQVLGSVVRSRGAGQDRNQGTAVLTLRVTTLRCPTASVPIRVRALAIASGMEVSQTADPAVDGSDKGNSSPANWITRQVGGDEVNRADWSGEVLNGSMQRVGFADFHGVYADPPPGATGAAAVPHALGPFSAGAHGLYSYDPESTLDCTGEDITIRSIKPFDLRRGDNLLLQVLGASGTGLPSPSSNGPSSRDE